jgi:hypothetical protein
MNLKPDAVNPSETLIPMYKITERHILHRSRDIIRYMGRRAGVRLAAGQVFLNFTASSPAPVPIKRPSQRVRGALSQESKRQRLETDRLCIFNAEVKNGGAYISIAHISSWHSA